MAIQMKIIRLSFFLFFILLFLICIFFINLRIKVLIVTLTPGLRPLWDSLKQFLRNVNFVQS